MEWREWVPLVLLVLFACYHLKVCYRNAERENRAHYYTIYLLLSDDIRQDHKKKFLDFLKVAQTKDSHQLMEQILTRVLPQMENALAEASPGSILYARRLVEKAVESIK